MTNNINIDEVISDKNSAFNIKIFKIGNLKFERVLKVIDSKDLTKNFFIRLVSPEDYVINHDIIYQLGF